MDAPPVTDTDLPPPLDAAARPVEGIDDDEAIADRVVLGVAGYVADGLGVDALWVRIGFVLLALAGGVGVVAYLALWLTLFGPECTGLTWLRYVGGAAMVVAVPWLVAVGESGFIDGPVVVIALLIGLTLALWQPRRAPRPPARPLPVPLSTPLPVREAIDPEPEVTPRQRRVRRVRRRREPSMLGRLTFALAVIVAAIGALIDQLNGGRLHPEQWLGAAAIVCGAGLLVGAIRGRGRWLVVPAILFASAGYLAGIMGRLGIDVADALGSQSVYVAEGRSGGIESIQRAVGTVWISVDGAPTDPLTIDARVAIGGIEMSVADDVAVEIRVDSDRGDLVVDGEVVADGVRRLGPDGPPSVIVDARLGIGGLDVFTYDPGSGDRYASFLVGDGVEMSTDGSVMLAGGEAMLAPDNSVVVGNATSVGPWVVSILTGMGTFVVDGSTLHTPSGAMYDLDELRHEFGIAGPYLAPDPAPDPFTTTTVAGG